MRRRGRDFGQSVTDHDHTDAPKWPTVSLERIAEPGKLGTAGTIVEQRSSQAEGGKQVELNGAVAVMTGTVLLREGVGRAKVGPQ
jgi:hypothetical protein